MDRKGVSCSHQNSAQPNAAQNAAPSRSDPAAKHQRKSGGAVRAGTAVDQSGGDHATINQKPKRWQKTPRQKMDSKPQQARRTLQGRKSVRKVWGQSATAQRHQMKSSGGQPCPPQFLFSTYSPFVGFSSAITSISADSPLIRVTSLSILPSSLLAAL